jgi:ATP-dependent RNA helicase RhlE
LADSILIDPVRVEVTPQATTVEKIDQSVFFVNKGDKRALLEHLLRDRDRAIRRVLVFTRTKHGANKLAEQLNQDGIRALAIHGNKSQGARTRALSEFKEGGLRVLVATDIAARGIDIDQLPHVVNYDLPNVPEDYVHRIGRTGRAGATGEAISLVCVDERDFLRDIERLLKRLIPEVVIACFAPDPRARAQPILQRQGRGQPQGRGAAPGQQRRAPAGGHGSRGQPRSAPAAHRSGIARSRDATSPGRR